MLLRIRSVLFWISTVLLAIIVGMLGLVTLLTMRPAVIAYVPYLWSTGTVYLMRWICGLKSEVIGLENLPKKPFIVACKHQSMWETVFLFTVFINPAFILKKELCKIPIYGWYIKFGGMISVDRSKASSVKEMPKQVKKVFDDNRVLVIFPEGTRVAVGGDVAYKPGIYAVHKDHVDTPIVPAAVNSGLFWNKTSFLIHPGTVKIKFMPPIIGEYSKDNLLSTLKDTIDSESQKLLKQ